MTYPERKRETGVMVDVGRKYFRPETLARLIGVIADLGLNTLQLHFSEDMGLGLDCPAYPWLAGRDGILCTQGKVGTVFPDTGFLTVPELTDLLSLAASKGINVIPSLDSPGHLNYTVKRFHDRVAEKGSVAFGYGEDQYEVYTDGSLYGFRKNGKELNLPAEASGVYGIGSYFLTGGVAGRVQGTNNHSYSRGIDLSNEVAVAFLKSVIGNYANLFYALGCRDIDVGGDELLGFRPAVVDLSVLTRWNQLDSWREAAVRKSGLSTAVAYDLFVIWMNSLMAMMKDIGYRSVRIWNDEFRRTFDTGWTPDPAAHVQFDPSFTVQYWSSKPNYESPASLARAGYRLINADSSHSYYVLITKARSNPPESYTKVTPEAITAEWDPFRFGTGEGEWDLSEGGERAAVAGAIFCDWNDCPTLRTDEEVVDEMIPLLEAWSKKALGTI